MLSFPSTLNTGGNNINLPTIPRRSAADILKNIGQSFVNSLTNSLTGGLFAFVNGASASGGKPDMSRLPYDYTVAPNLARKNIFSETQVGSHPSTRGRLQFNGGVGATFDTGSKWNYLYNSTPLIIDPTVY